MIRTSASGQKYVDEGEEGMIQRMLDVLNEKKPKKVKEGILVLVDESFPDHAGRPGEVGGSLPRGAAAQGELFKLTPERQKETEAFETGELKFHEVVGAGEHSNEVLRVDIIGKDGTSRVAIFKPQSGEVPGARADIPDGEGTQREVAAVRVAETLGIPGSQYGRTKVEMPVTVMRTVPGKGLGAIIGWADGGLTDASRLILTSPAYKPAGSVKPGHHVTTIGAMPHVDRAAVSRIAAYDYIIGNEDGHNGNWRATPDGTRIALIDHNLTFGTGEKEWLRSVFLVTAKNEKLAVSSIGNSWDNKWPDIEKSMRNSGIRDAKIVGAAKSRFDELMKVKKEGGTFAALKLNVK